MQDHMENPTDIFSDFLEREVFVPDNKYLSEKIKDKVILVTGAAGSIGSEIARHVLKFQPEKLILLDNAETPLYFLFQELNEFPIAVELCDIRNTSRLEQVFSKYTPSIVYHAAAYKQLPLMEAHPYESLEVNLGGTLNLLKLSGKYSVERFVQLSTDKAVNPTSLMGATKKLAELYCRYFSQKYSLNVIITRFGNVLGSNGSVYPLFLEQIKKGGPVTITHREVKRYFMTSVEAALLTMQATFLSHEAETYLFEMGDPVSISNLAKKMIMLFAASDIPIEIVGLRDAEKLEEELLCKNERIIDTAFQGIYKIEGVEIANAELAENIDKLLRELDLHTQHSLKKEIHNLLPDYTPAFDKTEASNPLYQALYL